MANQSISLSNYDPDMARIQRQQQLAQMLQEQSQQDIPIQSYNGIQAPISPFSILAKALQSYSARKNADQADTKYTDLQTKRQQGLADAIKNYGQPYKTVDTSPAADAASAAQAQDLGGEAPQQYAMAQPSQQQKLLEAMRIGTMNAPGASEMGSYLAAQNTPKYTSVPGVGLVNTNGANGQPTVAIPAVEKPDANQQDYKAAVSQGFKGTYLDFRKQLSQNTHVTVDTGAHGWQVVNDPGTGQPYRYNPNTGQATALNGSALTSAPTGYAKVATPNMRNPVAIYMDSWSKEHPGASAADKLTAMNSFAGQQATARTLGNIEGKVGSAANGLDIMAGQANEAYNKLGRGNFVPFNKLQQMASTNAFSSPEQADAYAADTGVINLWGKAINPSGVLTVEAQRRGEQMLSQAQSPEAHAAVLARMVAESRASKAGVSASQAGIGAAQAPTARIPVRTGKDAQGNKVVQYSDGTIEHAP